MMAIELITILSILVSGSTILHSLGMRGWGLPFVGFLVGTGVYIGIGFIQIITPLSTNPAVTVVASLLLACLALLSNGRYSKKVAPPRLSWVATGLLLVALLVIVFREAHLVTWHIDSFRYLMTSSLIAGGHYDGSTFDLIMKRNLGVPLVHAPAHMAGEWYLRSFHPLVSVSTIGSIAWMAWVGLKSRFSAKRIALFTTLGLLGMVSINRYVFHSFYINGHLLFGAMLALLVGSVWLLAEYKSLRPRVPMRALLAIIVALLPALVVTRPEGSLIALLALIPLALSPSVKLNPKQLVFVVYGLSVALWNSFIVYMHLSHPRDIPASAWVTLLLGVTALLFVLITVAYSSFYEKLIKNQGTKLLWLAEASLWALFVVLAARKPDIFVDSAKATVRNLVLNEGGWGGSLLLLGLLVGGFTVWFSVRGQHYIRFVITASVALLFMTAFLRDIAFRVGDGDSLNRMVMQVVPMIVMYLIVMSISGESRWGLSKNL